MRLVQLKDGEKMAKALKNKIIKSNKENKYIFDFIIDDIKNNCLKNTFIYNEGGIGKTTQLKKLVQMLLSPESRKYASNIIPVYIAVKDLHGSKKVNILFNSIKKFCGKDSSDEELENLLDGSSSLREDAIFLFIIDGLNEAKEEIKRELQREVNDLMKFEQNIFIVSSRIDETNTFLGFEKKLFVKPLGNVCEILNVQKNEINPKLLEILSVPLYLKYYLDTYKKDDFDFYENKSVKKSDILSKYVQHIEKSLELNTVSYENDVMDFVINYYLPSLAFEVNNFVDLNEVLDVINDEDYYRKFNVRTKKTAKYLQLDLFEIVVKTFALFNENTNSFVHDIWKEYFVASYYSKCIDKDIIEVFDNLPSEEVREFIGEITGECDFENVTELEEAKKSPLNQFLQRHNLQQSLDKQLSDMQTRNIIEIMKTARNNHITSKFLSLNLTKCSLMRCDCRNSNFNYSQLKIENLFYIGHLSAVDKVVVSNDNTKIISCSRSDLNRTVIVWDIITGIILKKIYVDCDVTACEIINNTEIVIGSDDGKIQRLNIDTGLKVGNSMCESTGWINDLKVIDNGQKLVSVSREGVLKIWDLSSGKPIREEKNVGISSWTGTLCVSDDGHKILYGNCDNKLKIWDIKNKWKETTISFDDCITAVSIVPKGNKALLGTYENSIYIYDFEKDKIVKLNISDGFDRINSVVITQDGNECIVCSHNGIKLFNINKPCAETYEFDCFDKRVNDLFVTNDGKLLVSATDSIIEVFSINTRKSILKLNVSYFADFSNSDFSNIIFCGNSEEIKILNIILDSQKAIINKDVTISKMESNELFYNIQKAERINNFANVISKYSFTRHYDEGDCDYYDFSGISVDDAVSISYDIEQIFSWFSELDDFDFIQAEYIDKLPYCKKSIDEIMRYLKWYDDFNVLYCTAESFFDDLTKDEYLALKEKCCKAFCCELFSFEYLEEKFNLCTNELCSGNEESE